MLPPHLRKPRLYALLKAMVAPIRDVYTRFTDYSDTVARTLNMNGSVIYLEKVLNDAFFLPDGEIYITDITYTKPVYMHNSDDHFTPSYLYNYDKGRTVVKNKVEENMEGAFKVNVPAYLDQDQYIRRIENLVNYYRPAGRQFKIEIYE